MGFGVLGFWDFRVLGFWGFGVLGFWGFGVLGFWGFGVWGFWGLKGLGFGVWGLGVGFRIEGFVSCGRSTCEVSQVTWPIIKERGAHTTHCKG